MLKPQYAVLIFTGIVVILLTFSGVSDNEPRQESGRPTVTVRHTASPSLSGTAPVSKMSATSAAPRKGGSDVLATKKHEGTSTAPSTTPRISVQPRDPLHEKKNAPVLVNSKTGLEDSETKIPAVVTKVIDGDTVRVNDLNGEEVVVRLIGIDAPETVDPRAPVQCYGKEASQKARELLEGKQVTLQTDPTQGERDIYGRMLTYLFLPDGTNFNAYMIKEGYAHEYTYRTPYRYRDEFKRAEQEARKRKKGLWADDACSPPRTAPPATPVTTNREYVCTHDAYNCKDFATHLQAQEVYDACGGASNDVHKLDRDKDGIACESLP